MIMNLLLALTLAATPTITAIPAKVVSVGDGDTLRVQTAQATQTTTIRLACIDAPEISQSPYGKQSRDHLAKIIPVGTEITVRPIATDRYGRTVAEVFLGPSSVNLRMVQSGNAFVYRTYQKNCPVATYSLAESSARNLSLGVWQVPDGIQRPWAYRSALKGRLKCSDISSYEEAQFLLQNGHSYLDSNKNGIACESLHPR